jgi:hypothetical protein
MPIVELLFFPDCPNVPAARELLTRAMVQAGLRPLWTEHDVTSPDAPEYTRGFGSPTILVDKNDVTGSAPLTEGSSCRIYVGSEVRGVPPLESVLEALQASTSQPPSTAGRRGSIGMSLAVVPGALLSALPVVGCPSCWPAYAGVLSSLGVPFLMDATWLLPFTIGALVLALVALGFRATQRRGFGPFVLGVAASTGIVLGKFVLDMNTLVYVATALLAGASVWNSWPRTARATSSEACGCTTTSSRA